MTQHVNDAGTWRQLQSVYVNDAGTWRTIQEVYVNDAGTWRSVFQNVSVQLQSDSYTNSGAASTISFVNDGTVLDNGAIQYSWLVGGLASSVDIRMTVTSGSFSSGTVGSWLNLDTTRSWTRNWSGGASTDTVLATVELRNATTLDLLATASIAVVATP